MKLWQKLALISSGLAVLSVLLCSALQTGLARESMLSAARTQALDRQRALSSSFQEMADLHSAGEEPETVRRSLVNYCFRRLADEKAVLIIGGEVYYSQLALDPRDYLSFQETSREASAEVTALGRKLFICGTRLYLAAYPDESCLVYTVEDMSPVYHSLERLVLRFALIGAVCALLCSGLVIVLLRRAMRPLAALKDAASQIAAGDYSKRLRLETGDELGQLAASFDSMAGAVERNIDELRDINRRQKLFIGGVSHEFKTPLTGIILSADALQNTYMSEQEQARAVERIAAQAKWLEALGQKMLRLLTLEREISTGPVDVPELFERLRESTESALEQQGVELKTDCRAERLNGDAELLRAALINLVENAARASEPGQSVRVSAYDNILEVADSGRGMEPETLKHVTEPFYMADKARSKKHGGVGLGLALVEETARAHGAELKIESKAGEGTRVKLIFNGSHPECADGNKTVIPR